MLRAGLGSEQAELSKVGCTVPVSAAPASAATQEEPVAAAVAAAADAVAVALAVAARTTAPHPAGVPAALPALLVAV